LLPFESLSLATVVSSSLPTGDGSQYVDYLKKLFVCLFLSF
jgi:hypothetical protein